MRQFSVLFLAVVILGSAGCASKTGTCCCCSCCGKDGWLTKMKNKILYRDTTLKPEPEPEKYVVPAPDDTRFSSPVQYPKEFRDIRTQRDKDKEFNPLQQGGLKPSSMRATGGGPGF